MMQVLKLFFIGVFLTLIGVFCWGVDGGHDHFFQYANIPSPHAYEFGYNRGNPHHFTSRFEKAHGWTFKTKVRWGDKHGWGESYWDYNHGDEKKGHKGHHNKGWGHHGHASQQGAFSDNVGVVDGNNFEERGDREQFPRRLLPRQQQREEGQKQYKQSSYGKYY